MAVFLLKHFEISRKDKYTKYTDIVQSIVGTKYSEKTRILSTYNAIVFHHQ
jgi:hypothetical protein